MKTIELVTTVLLLTLVLLNLHRALRPKILDDLKVLKTNDARRVSALWSISLSVALPAYVGLLISLNLRALIVLFAFAG